MFAMEHSICRWLFLDLFFGLLDNPAFEDIFSLVGNTWMAVLHQTHHHTHHHNHHSHHHYHLHLDSQLVVKAFEPLEVLAVFQVVASSEKTFWTPIHPLTNMTWSCKMFRGWVGVLSLLSVCFFPSTWKFLSSSTRCRQPIGCQYN